MPFTTSASLSLKGVKTKPDWCRICSSADLPYIHTGEDTLGSE